MLIYERQKALLMNFKNKVDATPDLKIYENDDGEICVDVNGESTSVPTIETIDLTCDEAFKIGVKITLSDGSEIESSEIDLPMESVVMDGSYDSESKSLILTLQNGSTIAVPVDALINGLQEEITADNKLSADLVDGISEEVQAALDSKVDSDVLSDLSDRVDAVEEEAVQAAADAADANDAVVTLGTRVDALETATADIDAISEKATSAAEDAASAKASAEAVETALASKADTTYVDGKVSDIEAEIAGVNAEVAKRVERTLDGANGKALIFNETDGGGAKFEHTDGTWSALAVNDGGKDGIAAQIYALVTDEEGKKNGTRLDVTKDAIYYTVGNQSFSDRKNSDNEIATKGNVAEVESIANEAKATAEAAKTAASAASTAVAGKIDVLPGDEHTAGNPYNLPYYFRTAADADKIVVTAETVTLDGNKTYGAYDLEVPSASTATAGLMSAADKVLVNTIESKASASEVTALNTRIETIEAKLPDLPANDDEYALHVIMEDGKATYKWVAVENP